MPNLHDCARGSCSKGAADLFQFMDEIVGKWTIEIRLCDLSLYWRSLGFPQLFYLCSLILQKSEDSPGWFIHPARIFCVQVPYGALDSVRIETWITL